jgi:hypothetical protein
MPTRCNQYIYVMFSIESFFPSKKRTYILFFSLKKKEKKRIKERRRLNSNLVRWAHTCRSRPREKRLLYIYFHEILLIAETSGLLCAYEELKRSYKDNTRDN